MAGGTRHQHRVRAVVPRSQNRGVLGYPDVSLLFVLSLPIIRSV